VAIGGGGFEKIHLKVTLQTCALKISARVYGGAERLSEVYAYHNCAMNSVTNLPNSCVLWNRIVYNPYNSNIPHAHVILL
jgi:hypothetical protein